MHYSTMHCFVSSLAFLALPLAKNYSITETEDYGVVVLTPLIVECLPTFKRAWYRKK